jgi:hypothetical protein
MLNVRGCWRFDVRRKLPTLFALWQWERTQATRGFFLLDCTDWAVVGLYASRFTPTSQNLMGAFSDFHRLVRRSSHVSGELAEMSSVVRESSCDRSSPNCERTSERARFYPKRSPQTLRSSPAPAAARIRALLFDRTGLFDCRWARAHRLSRPEGRPAAWHR